MNLAANRPHAAPNAPASGTLAMDRRASAAALVLLAVLALAWQSSRSLWEPDEGRYTAVALQMLDSGNWWVPHLNDAQPHLAKPPLTYWLIAASVGVLGRSEWAVRLPFVLAFVLTGWLVLVIARALALPRPALAPVIWASSLGPFLAAGVVTTDPLLTLFETCAIAAFLRSGVLERDVPERAWIRLMWFAYACGFMTKGPPALLPLLASLVWLRFAKRKAALRALFDPSGVVLFCAFGVTWYAALVVREPRLLGYFLGYELFDRIFSGVHGRNASLGGLVRTYLPTLAAGLLPWGAVALWRRLPRERGAPETQPPRCGPERPFLWCWLLVPLGIFMIARSRLPLYLLPLFVPLALLLHRDVAAVWQRNEARSGAVTALWLLLLVGARAGISHYPTSHDARALGTEIKRAMSGMREPAKEIVYVARQPAYGLRFYLGVPTVRVELAAGRPLPGGVATWPAACDGAARADHALWLVEPAHEAALTRTLRTCGYEARRLASRVRNLTALEVVRGALHAEQRSATDGAVLHSLRRAAQPPASSRPAPSTTAAAAPARPES